VVQEKSPLVVADLSQEARSETYQNLVERLNLHFYAGIPVSTPEGHAVGALCVMDHIPRRFSRRDLESLADFAAIVEDEMMFKRAGLLQRELVSQVEKLRLRAFVDQLTGVWNRGAVFDVLQRELERSERNNHPLSACMLDLDHFKKVNDEYGHQAGDHVLQELCQRVRASIRPYDGIGRYGGEEFLIVFPETQGEQARSQADRVRKTVAAVPFDLGDGVQKTVTCSIGVAEYERDEDLTSLISRADKALYRAKNEGRDRVVLAD
jgi:diguanylate cyclase (GGDEF)-like protein